MKIQYSKHLEFRLAFRNIPYDLPKKIYKGSKEKYFDAETKNFVAIKRVKYQKKIREMAVVYQGKDEDIVLITIHPLKFYQKESRIQSGRWQKI